MKNLYLEKILEIHKSFCLITGLNSIIIDKNGEILSAQSPSYTFCNRFISLNKNNINVCKGCELKKIDINTENIHEGCCFPFWSCNVPIKVNGETVAKIFIGEALSDKLNDNELMRLSRQCKIEFTDIKNGINNTPILVDEQKNEVVHLLQNISGMASHHYSETEKYREDVTRLRMLDKIARNINSPTHLYTIYDTIYRLAPKLIPFDTFCILLFDEKEDEFKVDYVQGVGADILRTAEFRKGEGYAGWVLREKKELIINDATIDSPVPIKYKRLMVEAGLVSYFVVPLQIEDKTVGCFIIASKEKNNYSEHQIETINTFACWAAIAINKNDLIAKKNKMFENKQRVLGNYLPHFFESPIDLFGIKIKNIITPEIECSYEYIRETGVCT